MLRNILGPVFNLYLDQFLTFKICIFFWGGGGGAEAPIVFQQKCKIRETQKIKILFVNTFVLTVLVKMSVFFYIFHFGGFRNFQFLRDVFDWWPKFKK